MAPEMLQNKPYSNAVDWWALGIMLYRMTHKSIPFIPVRVDGVSSLDIMKGILVNTVIAEIQFPESVSNDICQVVRLLLKKDPQERLKSLEDLLKEKLYLEET
ncbi:uncharacterized protein MELLADRAFT_96356 [Melampsora larici-populina 98AG31]|uniref:Protein kinase domain-containing protein n=1 Tax=Melampsora larici-populina (strain 98AG31 / pathotype 3-4-7) TaxID=747676 RepID=F4REH1_MELLP|nr:uncharacterized protein MELLADRAFT_96356 [Melampsora larici-populina 98AG31]EGG09090.1 hypothetical protein MELLADRAFT_96356 [Melampsora larici-populina 98AG31]